MHLKRCNAIRYLAILLETQIVIQIPRITERIDGPLEEMVHSDMIYSGFRSKSIVNGRWK